MSKSDWAYEKAMERWIDMTLQEKAEAIAEHADTHDEWEEFKHFIEWVLSKDEKTALFRVTLVALRGYLEDRASAYLAYQAQRIREGEL